MKKILAFLLSIALLITALPIGMITLAEDSASVETSITMKADDSRIHRSSSGTKAYTANDGLAIVNSNMTYDCNSRAVKVCIYNLKTLMTETIGSSSDKGIDRYPYVITKINVKEAGYYNIGTEINMRADGKVNTMVIVVDGVIHVVEATLGSDTHQTVWKNNLYLSEGEHSILYMSAIPQNESDCPATADKYYYPWTNFWSFTFVNVSGKDINESLEILDASTLTGTDVENIFKESTRIEAEDTKYVTWNIYDEAKTGQTSASGGSYVGGPSYSQCQQTFEEIASDGLDKAKMPYLQYMVEAPAAGEYYLTIGANVGKSSANPSETVPYVAVLVNDNDPVKAQFDGTWGAYDSVTVSVQLQEGLNIIRCTSVTHEQYSEGTAWVNLDYFEVQKGLSVKRIMVDAADEDCETYLYLNKYQDNDKSFGGTNYNDIRYDYPSLYEDMLGIYSDIKTERANYWPYIAFTVRAELAGEYQISAKIGTRAEAKTFGMIVDGTMHVVEVTTTSGELTKSVYLTAGEHVIIFTSPMPRDMESRPTTTGSNTQYAYMDFSSFSLSEGLCFGEKVTDADIQTAMTNYSRIESEGASATANGNYNADVSKDYVRRYNSSYTVKVKGVEGATIDGSVSETEKNVNSKQTYADIAAGKLDKELTSYIHYVVNADKAGTYVLRIGAYVEGSGTMPYGTILVNGKAYKAQFSGIWNGYDAVNLPVELEAGINTIQCVGITAEQTSVDTAWIGYDYLDIPEGLTAGDIEVKASDNDWNNYLYLNSYTDSGSSFGGPNYNDMRYDYPSLYEDMLGIYSNVRASRANYWPYIAFTVCAEQAGEYPISASIGTNANAKTIGMLVDGAMYVIDVTTTSGYLTKSVYLTEGEHVIVFTSPIFRDMESRPTTTGSSTQYPYMDYKAFKLSAGLSFREAPIDADIQTAMTNYSRTEAEGASATANGNYDADVSKDYVRRYNSPYKVNIKGVEDATIDGSVSALEKNVNTTQTYADIVAGKLDKELTSYIHYVVNADKAGTYVLRVGAYVEGSGAMPYGTILVNGKAYKAQFSGDWNGYDAVNLAVELNEGKNTIQCVGITADQTCVESAWIGYDYLDIPEGLTACDTEVKASDSDWNNYLYLNSYTDKGSNFGGPNYNDMRYDFPSLYEDMLGIYSDVKPDRANYWPYIAFTVCAEQTGEYQISADIGTNANAKTIGMIVDGAMHVIDVTTTSGYLTKSVYLTAGEHVIVFTSPIFRDMESRPTTTGSSTQYPYMDYKAFKLSAGLSFREAPIDADIQIAMTNYLRIEAEGDFATVKRNYNADISTEYVRKYDSPYTVKVKGTTGAVIDGTVTTDEKSVNTTQTYTDIANDGLAQDTSYVQYEVTAKKAGTYVIRVGAYVEGSGTMPYGTVLVNGEAYKAQFSDNWNGYDAVNLAVELQAGENIIQCIGVTADQTGTDGWIGYDYLEIPRGLTYHDAGEYTYTSVTSGLSFNKRTTYETEGTITQEPYTISTWIYLPSEYTSRGGVIFGNYSAAGVPCASFEIYENGVPRFFHLNGNGKKVDLEFNKVNVCTDEWTNLTFTISGNKVSCYKNGVHMQTLSPILYNIEMSAVKNPYVLGGDLRQEIATNGTTNVQYFKGRIIDVALYNTALSEEEVLKVYHAEKISAEPYTRYKLENAERDEDVPDTTGNNNLDAKLSYFKEKEAVTDYAYSFAVVGDTQIVTENDVKNQENNLSKIYDWILANKEQKNIQYVFGLGDITDNNTTTEWGHAQNEISRLNGEIPYSLVRGNHDLKDYGKTEDTTADYMTQYLGTDAYKSQFSTNTETGTEGGFYSADDISNSWRTFTVGQVKYLMITLDYGPSDDVLNWAGKIIKEHPEHSVIITTHAYLYRDGTTLDAEDTCPPSTSGGVNNGDDMWNELVSQYENIVLVLSGHDPSDNIVMSRDVGVNGNVVTSMLIDPQGVDYEDGSTGMLAMLYFSADGTKVQVEYFSTVKEAYFKEENQFSFELADCGRQVKEYTAQQVIDFKTQGTYPKDVEGLEDYLFAGWYTDRACDEASLLKDVTPTGTTYALFVPKHVLSVKAQISTNLLDSNTENDGAASIRFVTTVDTLLYKKVGFNISYTDANGQKQEFESASGTVYQKLYAVNSESKIDTITPNKYFCGLSAYFKACTITDIPEDYYNTEFTVTPFWITMDGATVYGDTVTKTVNMGISKW